MYFEYIRLPNSRRSSIELEILKTRDPLRELRRQKDGQFKCYKNWKAVALRLQPGVYSSALAVGINSEEEIKRWQSEATSKVPSVASQFQLALSLELRSTREPVIFFGSPLRTRRKDDETLKKIAFDKGPRNSADPVR